MSNKPLQKSTKNSLANQAETETSTPAKPGRDRWDKFEILTRPFAAFLTALTIAIISYFGQSTITALSLQEQNARLYTELLARREDAESSLRKDMFKEIMSGFFEELDVKDVENDLSKNVLKLELLAINFGDSLSLGPLFSEMSNDIERVLKTDKAAVADWKIVASRYQKRLRSLAKRVASSQLSAIDSAGVSLHFEVPTEIIEKNATGLASTDWRYTWPYDQINSDSGTVNVVVLDGIKRAFEIRFRNADYANQSVQVKLDIFEFVTHQYVDDNGVMQSYEEQQKVSDLEFSLDFFNFPLIDNTRLSNNHRFTLILEDFDSNTIKVAGMAFPGLYASQRDKPFLNEAIQELSDQRVSKQE